MHYPFEAGLIKQPPRFVNGLTPEAGLSDRDRAQVRFFYPGLDKAIPELRVLEPRHLTIAAGEQKNFSIIPDRTRRYNIRTFGESDTVMVLFEDESGELR